MIVVVEAWNVQGQWTGLQAELLKSATPQSEIVIRDAFQGPILKFQVRVHRKAKSKLEPLEYFGLILHSLNITEYSYNPNECPYTPPVTPDGPVRKINAVGPDDNLHLSYDDGSLSIAATQKLFEPHSLKLKFDTRSFPYGFTADNITVSISTDDTCANPVFHDYRRFNLNPETRELTFSPDDNFRITKIYEMAVMFHLNVSWWLEELVVKEWEELPGCYPCGINKKDGCEWPMVERSQARSQE
ncbi:hypothetical protein BDD12DRAFT_843888 [Trichophaea hybrida]|nr:hypothetical protein BDD12DRAFT_843888 [Trichophaea hybrida]